MISVQNALDLIVSIRPTPESETVDIAKATGRILARDVTALIGMPPFPSANMDGYAVADCETGAPLKIIGESAAGHPFVGNVATGEAIRISTGAVMPQGTDRVAVQENAQRKGDVVTLTSAPKSGHHVRAAASDFHEGQKLLSAGHRLTPAELTLAAASGHSQLEVKRKLTIALFSSGDELQVPGTDLENGNIYAANAVGLKPLLESWGADVTDFGIVGDSSDAIDAMIPRLTDFDFIIPIGGASVGDHDHMRPGFQRAGFDIIFNTVAIRPGKPSWMGQKPNQIIFGLPGNPASAFVCAHLFLRPLLGHQTQYLKAKLRSPLEENGPRETFLRANAFVRDGQLCSVPKSEQDSFRLRPQSAANALLRIPPLGGPYRTGDMMDMILIDGWVGAE